MEAQIQSTQVAFWGLLAAFLVFGTWLIKVYMPKAISDRHEQWVANQSVQRTDTLNKSNALAEEKHADTVMQLSAAKLLEIQGQTMLGMLEEQRLNRQAVSMNALETKANGTQIVGLTEAVGQLRESVDTKVGEALTKLEEIKNMPSLSSDNNAQLNAAITTLTDLANGISHTQVDLNLVGAAIRDAQVVLLKSKGDSKPIPAVTMPNDTTANGKTEPSQS